MSTSRFGVVVDALAVVVGTAGSTTFVGPPLTSDVPVDYVVVWGTEDPDDDGGEFTQDWNGLGARTKQERGEVQCAVLVSNGDDDLIAARDRALVILALIETAIRTDPSLGGVLIAGWSQVASGRPSVRRGRRGTYVRIAFTVAYQTAHI